jgi:copper chaperone NosL
LNADHASYVLGSNAMGPMRAGNLPAFAQRKRPKSLRSGAAARWWMRDQITPRMLQSLSTGRVRHQHP